MIVYAPFWLKYWHKFQLSKLWVECDFVDETERHSEFQMVRTGNGTQTWSGPSWDPVTLATLTQYLDEKIMI